VVKSRRQKIASQVADSKSAPVIRYYDTINRFSFQVKYLQNMAFSVLKSWFEKTWLRSLAFIGRGCYTQAGIQDAVG
jgi:hypothetical protein